MTAAMRPTAPTDIVDRLLARTKRVGECLIWATAAEHLRPPRVCIGGKTLSVRRLIYSELVGPMPSEAKSVPSCGNPACIEPSHIRIPAPGNQRDIARNVARVAKRAQQRADKRAAKPAVVKPPVIKPEPVVAPAPCTSFVFTGADRGVNAFTAVLGART